MRPTFAPFAALFAVAACALPAAAGAPSAEAVPTSACNPAVVHAGKVIVLLRADAGSPGRGQAGVLAELAASGASSVTAYHLIDAVSANVSAAASCSLARDPDVLAVVPDRQLRLSAGIAPAVRHRLSVLAARPASTVTEPESLSLTGATTVQSSGDGGLGVRVADIDSGLDTTQPNMQGVLAQNASGQSLYRDFTGTDLQDAMGHGTGTAGMIVSQGVTTYGVSTTPYYGPLKGDPTVVTPFRVLGMAPAAKLIVAKVFDPRLKGGGGYASWIVSAVQWAVDNHAQVINESFGWQDVPTGGPDPVALADEAAAKAGVVVCVAAGNSGPGFGTIADPAADGSVLAVGASTMFRDLGEDGYLALYGKYVSDSVASFSSRGPTSDGAIGPDLLSPGEDGWSVFAGSGPAAGAGVGLFSGTSQASPIVAGAAALVISAYQHRHGSAPPVGYVKQLLMNTADDLGLPAEDQSSGRVDVARAVAAVDGTGPDISIAPTSLGLAGAPGAVVTQSVVVTNQGTSPVSITAGAFTQRVSATKTVSGTTPASKTGASASFSTQVYAGTDLLSAKAIWRTSDGQALDLQLFDPQGRLVAYAGGAGIASVEASHPEAGTWTVFVGNDSGNAEPFRVNVTTAHDVAIGTVTPATSSLAAGASEPVALTLQLPSGAGRTVSTLQLRLPGGTETVPVVTTVDVPASGTFAGAFNGPSSSGPDDEVYTYDVTVPAGAPAVSATVSWAATGNGVEVFLVDPAKHDVVHARSALTKTSITVTAANPVAGTWQVIVSCPVFSGLVFSLPFSGVVRV